MICKGWKLSLSFFTYYIFSLDFSILLLCNFSHIILLKLFFFFLNFFFIFNLPWKPFFLTKFFFLKFGTKIYLFFKVNFNFAFWTTSSEWWLQWIPRYIYMESRSEVAVWIWRHAKKNGLDENERKKKEMKKRVKNVGKRGS